MNMSDCIFCKIIKGELPSSNVYEDESVIAFLDHSPVNPGHALVVSKEHHPDLVSTPPQVISKLIEAAQTIAPAVLAATDSQGFNLNLNNGSAAGQVVNHIHFHIVPRHPNDGLKLWPGQPYQAGEIEELADKIRNNISIIRIN